MDGMKLIDEARAAGLTVTALGNRLLIRGPRRAEAIAQRLLAHKAEVLAALDRPVVPPPLPADWHFLWDERAAIMEHEGGLPRELAEARALDDVVQQMLRAGIQP